MKRIHNLFDELVSLPNLLGASKKAFLGSGRSVEACRWMFGLEPNLEMLRAELQAESYAPSPYRYFQIHEPKERTVSVAAFRDRVVHHAIVNILEPVYEKSFYEHSYATRKNKGTHLAVRRAQRHLGTCRYYLKADIEKYFESIVHATLLEILGRKISDVRMLDLLSRIVANNDISRGTSEGRGLPIGNLTSQFLANVYLNGFDHYVVQGLRARRYIRYMDDFVVFSDDLGFLKTVRDSMRLHLDERLGLRLKEKATFINSRLNGLPFLGYRVFPSLLRIKPENARRIRRKIIRREKDFAAGRIGEDAYRQSLLSFFGYLQFAQTWSLRSRWLVEGGRRS